MATGGASAAGNGDVRLWTLNREEELRVEVDAVHTVTITLQKGSAEVFGSELCVDVDYPLRDVKLAVFSWHGCELSVRGVCKSAYTANETPLVSYINAHAALDSMRVQARQKDTRGPVALICGPTDSGKSSVARTLLNYAVRAGSKPLYIDLDVGQNAISIPGAIAATSVEQPIAIDSDALTIKAPLAYYYGHASPNLTELYKQFLASLSATITQRVAHSSASRHSGAIINTAGWIDGSGYELLLSIASLFSADVLIALGHERLYADLKADSRLSCTVVKLARSGGVVSRTAAMRAAARNRSIRDYFYGRSNELTPHAKTLSWRDVLVYRIGGGPQAPASTLPIGAQRLVESGGVVKVGVGLELLHSVLGVSWGLDGKAVVERSVCGFVYVSAVDVAKKTITLLAPAPGPLPSTCFITGSIKWQDL